MTTIGSNSFIVCKTCDGEVRLVARRTTGCLCDPDSPTWVGVEPSGRVFALNQSKYQLITEAGSRHNYE